MCLLRYSVRVMTGCTTHGPCAYIALFSEKIRVAFWANILENRTDRRRTEKVERWINGSERESQNQNQNQNQRIQDIRSQPP